MWPVFEVLLQVFGAVRSPGLLWFHFQMWWRRLLDTSCRGGVWVTIDVWAPTCDHWRVSPDVWALTCEPWRVSPDVWALMIVLNPMRLVMLMCYSLSFDPWNLRFKRIVLLYMKSFKVLKSHLHARKYIKLKWLSWEPYHSKVQSLMWRVLIQDAVINEVKMLNGHNLTLTITDY